MVRNTLAVTATALVVFSLSAEAAPRGPSGVYQLKETLDGNDYTGTMSFAAKGAGKFQVVVTEKTDGKDPVTWQGEGVLVNELLKIRRNDVEGIAPKIGDPDAGSKASIEYQALFDARFQKAHVVIQKVAPINGTIRHREIGSADLLSKTEALEAGELIVFSKAKLEELMTHGASGNKEVDLNDYVHVALGGGVRLLGDGERTGYMKGADEDYRSKNQKEPVWIELTATGGTRLGRTDISKDLNAPGTLTFQPGFGFETGIKYTLVDQYEKGLDLAAELAESPKTFKLPLDAAKAKAMPLGEQRTYDGYATLTLSGTLEYGTNWKELFKGYEDVRFDAQASVTWMHSGDMKLFVERQFNDLVHVKWSPSTEKDLGVAASVVFGLIHDDDKVNALKQPLREAASAGFKQAENYVTVQFNVSADWVRDHDLEYDMVFDLSKPEGCTAYEAAIRGDMGTVEKMALADGHPGIKSWSKTDTRSKALETSVQLDVFDLLKYNHSTETKSTHIEVKDLGGSSTTDTFSYDRSTDALLGKHHRELGVDGTAKSVTPVNSTTTTGIRFEVTFENDLGKTSKNDLADMSALVQTLFGSGSVAPVDTSGKKFPSQTKLDLVLGQGAIQQVLAASDESFIEAYAKACWGQGYVWNLQRVQALAQLDPTDSRNDGVHDELLRAKEALDALSRLHKAKAGTSNPVVEAQRLRDLAKSEGFKLHAVVAMALLSTRDDSQVHLTVTSGSTTLYDDSVGQAQDLPEDP